MEETARRTTNHLHYMGYIGVYAEMEKDMEATASFRV